MKTSRGALVLSLMLAVGTTAVLWGADAPGTGTTETGGAAKTAEALPHYQKALMFFRQGKYQQAADENDAALALNPNLRDAQLLKTLIDQNVAPGVGPGGPGVVNANRTLLSREEINRIRVNELSDNDLRTVQGNIGRKVLEDFWNNVVLKDQTQTAVSKEDYDKFVKPTNLAEQIRRIRDTQAADYYGKVNIAKDPEVMVTFKNLIQPFILQNCATSKCHGGNDNHGVPIVGLNRGDPTAVAYTNFYILSNFNYNGDCIIDRNNPERSLFIQFALDPNNALVAHPGKIPARFSNLRDPQAQRMVAWIKALHFPAPNYGITYKLPQPPAKAAPAPAAPATPAPAATEPAPAPAAPAAP